MRKIYLKLETTVVLNVEDDEYFNDLIDELEITHPDNTRVVDYSIEDWNIIDSK